MAETLSDLLEADRADAWAHFDRLAAIYAAELRRLAREAVTRFHRSQWTAPVLAAGTPAEWHIPDPDELIDAAKAAGELAGKTRKLREEIAQTSVGGTLAAYGINFDLRNPLIQGVLSQMGQHITQIVEDERSRIMASLNDSWEQGLSIRDAALAMKSDSVIESKMRAEMIARTELTGATNSGSLAAVRLINDASPPDTRMSKIWIATNDARTRETHSEASDQYGTGNGIPLTQPFNVGGFDLQHPGDPSGPPEEVINCRCTIAYEQGAGGEPQPPEQSALTQTINATAEPQPGALAHALITDAKSAEPAVTADLSHVMNVTSGKLVGLDFRLKSEGSITRKLAAKAEAKGISLTAYSQEIADVLRYTGEFSEADYVAGVERSIRLLRDRGYTIPNETIQNFWQFGDDYNGINLDVITPKGYKLELQFHTPGSFALKNGELHKLYEQFRESRDPFLRRELWDKMVSLSDALPRPEGSVLRIGTVTTHESPIAHGSAEVTAAVQGPPIIEGSTIDDALSTYVGFGYKIINTILRDGEFESSKIVDIPTKRDAETAARLANWQRKIADIVSAMIPAKKNVILYRGYKRSVLGDGPLTDLIGKTIEDKGFVSTTANLDRARELAQSGAKGSHLRSPSEQVILELVADKGTRVLSVARRQTRDGSWVPNYEEEVILPPGTKYRVMSVRKDADGRWVVRAVVE